MARPTRTYNPIHFEDLEPKRFEDLVRELIYDFRDWQSIEATGQGGDDDGFDIRAHERVQEVIVDEDDSETVHPMDGNAWMIQGKRQKSLGPSELRKILADVDERHPPYGYILAASVTFSKKSFDLFRKELTEKGVMEFYLWGRPELEGMLHLPKNDRILFTFFGVSTASRRRSRATEIRLGVTNKNRLVAALGETPSGSKVLLRDAKDLNYPFREEYADFDKRPRWRDYHVTQYHPLGLVLETRKQYAYLDRKGEKYDILRDYSLLFRDTDTDQETEAQRKTGELARDFWERLPIECQATYHRWGLVRFDDMLVVDVKGDVQHKYPHIYVDFKGDGGPFSNLGWEYLEVAGQTFGFEGLSATEIFPKPLPQPTFGKLHIDSPLLLVPKVLEQFRNYSTRLNTLYDVEGKYDYLKEGDVAAIGESADERFIQVTRRIEVRASEILAEAPHRRWDVEQQIGRKIEDSERLKALEFRTVYRHQFQKAP